jgi:hypothetical protein
MVFGLAYVAGWASFSIAGVQGRPLAWSESLGAVSVWPGTSSLQVQLESTLNSQSMYQPSCVGV